MSNTLTGSSPDSDTATATQRRTLVFLVGTDTTADRGPLLTAQHFAAVAAGAGLAAELRLAARAARSVGDLPVQPDGVDVTVCPRAVEKYGISADQLDAGGGRPRSLAEILTEVAEGTSVLIAVTHSIDDPQVT